MLKLKDSDAKQIKRRIRLAERYADRELKQNFKRALELYTGDFYEDSDKLSNNSRLSINYTLHVIETKVNSVAFRYPEFIIQPLTPAGEQTADIAHAALKYEWKLSNAQRECKRAYKDKEVFGAGVVYTGWLFETRDGMRMEDGRHALVEEQPDTTPNPLEEERQPVSQSEVREDRFLVKRLNPGHFFVNPECDRILDNAYYCGYWECVPLDEVKKNPHYQNTRQLKGNTDNLKPWFDKVYMDEVQERAGDEPADVKRVKLYHYYERTRQLHAIFTDEHDKPLYVENWSHPSDRYPFRTIQNPGDEDCFWPIPTPLLIEHPQKELNEARSQLSNHRRRATPAYQVNGGTLTPQAKKQLKCADSLRIVEHNGPEPLSIVPIAQQNIQPEVYTTEEKSIGDMQTLAALNQYQLGNVPTKRTTTSEVEAIQSQGGPRSENDRQEFEEFCAAVALDCINWLKQYSVKTRTIPVYDDQNQVVNWIDFTREQIQADYDICVYAHSTTAPNNADKIQGIGFLLQSLNGFLQVMPTAMQLGLDLMPLLRELLKSFPDIKNVDKIIPTNQNPVGQMPGAVLPQGRDMGAASQMEGGGAGIPPMAGGAEQTQIPPELLMALAQAQGQY